MTPKTRLVAIYPDGRRVPVAFRRGHYWIGGAGSNTVAGLRDLALDLGATLQREPDPAHRPARLSIMFPARKRT